MPGLFVIVALAACDTSDPAFRDAAPVRVRLGGSVFDIRVAGRQAEAIRRNPQWAPRLAAVAVPAVLAIERVSGCRVARLRGDQARMVAALDCGGGPPPVPMPSGELICDLDLHDDEETGTLYCLPFEES